MCKGVKSLTAYFFLQKIFEAEPDGVKWKYLEIEKTPKIH